METKITGMDLMLPMVLLAYRTSVQETTGATPYSLMFGHEARPPADVMFGTLTPPGQAATSSSDYALNLRQRLEKSFQEVRAKMSQKQIRQKELYDQKSHGAPFEMNDRVWFNFPAIPRGKHKKFHRLWQGPFVIKKKISDVLYQIQQENSSRNQIVHFDRLKPSWIRNFDNNAAPAATPNTEEEEEDYYTYIRQATPEIETSSSSEAEPMEESSGEDDQQSQPVLRSSIRTRRLPSRNIDYVPH